jgi:hypothetical protein
MEILSHGVTLLTQDNDTNRRLAMLSIDNSVELMIKTYLGLPQRVTGIQLSRKDHEEIGESFPRLLEAIHKYAKDKMLDLDISEIEWYHRLRNELYHQGNGLTVEREKVVAYAEIAKELFRQLFGHGLSPAQADFRQIAGAISPRTSPALAFLPPQPSNKAWFLTAERQGKRFYVALVNAKGSCSLRVFDKQTGRLLKKQYARGDYQDAFQDVLNGAKQLNVLNQPNLERDCREQLPPDILDELQGQTNE